MVGLVFVSLRLWVHLPQNEKKKPEIIRLQLRTKYTNHFQTYLFATACSSAAASTSSVTLSRRSQGKSRLGRPK